MVSDLGIPMFRGGNYDAGMNMKDASSPSSGPHIREWMKHIGLNQKRLAERIGIEPGTLSKLLNGEMGMTTDYLDRIASSLGIPMARLFSSPGAPDRAEGLSDEDLKVARFFARLQASDKVTVLQLAERLLPPSSEGPARGPQRPGASKPTQSE